MVDCMLRLHSVTATCSSVLFVRSRIAAIKVSIASEEFEASSVWTNLHVIHSVYGFATLAFGSMDNVVLMCHLVS